MNSRFTYLIGIGAPLLALLLIGGVSLEKFAVGPVGQRINDTPAGEIRGSITIGQLFTAHYNGLYRIDALMATYARENTHDVTFHLRSSPQADNDLVNLTVNAREIEDNQFRTFIFEPFRDSAGKSYYFFFDSPDSEPGDAVTVWGTIKDLYPEGRPFRNHRKAGGDLVFLTYYRPSVLDKFDILLDRLTANKPLFWGDRRFYLLLALLYMALLSLFLLQMTKISPTEEKGSDDEVGNST
jgi:hypothetical protein